MKHPRYDGKPLLRLVELYVLWSIGRLSAKDAARLNKMAPKLLALYGGDGTWQAAVAAAVKFPPDLPEAIRQIWEKNREEARQTGELLSPQIFAQRFVDSNSG